MSDQTIEQRLDEILQNYYDNTDDFVVGGMGFQEDNEDTAKQALLHLLNETRRDELKLHISALGLGHILMTKEDVDTRIAQLTPKENK